MAGSTVGDTAAAGDMAVEDFTEAEDAITVVEDTTEAARHSVVRRPAAMDALLAAEHAPLVEADALTAAVAVHSAEAPVAIVAAGTRSAAVAAMAAVEDTAAATDKRLR
jgi:hypothetical protein